MPGVMKRQTWNKRTGEERTRPPNIEILRRSDNPSSGLVMYRGQPPLESDLPFTSQSGLMSRCKMGA